MLLLAPPGSAQELLEQTFAEEGFRVVVTEGRELVSLPSAGAFVSVQLASGGFAAQSFETPSQRIHVVTFDGKTYRAATPLEGPRSRLVFDPARRAFASLLPSIRIELDGGVRPDTVAEMLGAVGATVFESLGFAIVDLPGEMHPADAVEQVRRLTGRPDAAVRLRGPRIEWR